MIGLHHPQSYAIVCTGLLSGTADTATNPCQEPILIRSDIKSLNFYISNRLSTSINSVGSADCVAALLRLVSKLGVLPAVGDALGDVSEGREKAKTEPIFPMLRIAGSGQ